MKALKVTFDNGEVEYVAEPRENLTAEDFALVESKVRACFGLNVVKWEMVYDYEEPEEFM